jgi:hypothetical protein
VFHWGVPLGHEAPAPGMRYASGTPTRCKKYAWAVDDRYDVCVCSHRQTHGSRGARRPAALPPTEGDTHLRELTLGPRAVCPRPR